MYLHSRGCNSVGRVITSDGDALRGVVLYRRTGYAVKSFTQWLGAIFENHVLTLYIFNDFRVDVVF